MESEKCGVQRPTLTRGGAAPDARLGCRFSAVDELLCFRWRGAFQMFEVMASGLPVLLAAPQGEASRIVERASGGICVPPEEPQLLADAIQELANEREQSNLMGQRGREFVIQHYNREKIADNFVAALEDILQREQTVSETTAPH